MTGNQSNNFMRKAVLAIAGLVLFYLCLYWINTQWDAYKVRILNLCAIYIGITLGLNLCNGFAGQFSLGIAGFMAVGAYTAALLTMSPQIKRAVYFIEPLISPLNSIQWGFLPSLIVAGLVSGLVGFAVGAPAIRFRDDYLGISTLGFAEIIRVVFTNTTHITNGALGLKGIPPHTNLYWSWTFALLCVFVMVRLTNSSYGRALKAIRDDEVAAEAMGVNLFYHKCLAFVVSATMAGIGGGLLGNLITTIDPNMFRFPLTFTVLMMAVLGGLGSITGSVISATVITIAMEALRVLEEPRVVLGIFLPGIPGMRMVVFSIALMLVILFYPKGFMGDRELGLDSFRNLAARFRRTFSHKQV
ncbi:MAG: branched-chain amino acid ABC transporter permease [Bacillota bacterium]|jgi:branched-chain amino acid transport system permease protein